MLNYILKIFFALVIFLKTYFTCIMLELFNNISFCVFLKHSVYHRFFLKGCLRNWVVVMVA